jgi:hypothetical protein
MYMDYGMCYWAFSCPCYFFKIKFKIGINNDELLGTTWEHKMKGIKKGIEGGGEFLY